MSIESSADQHEPFDCRRIADQALAELLDRAFALPGVTFRAL